jgi:hypothetical protein
MSEGVERRLAAILTADVVGYSRLMGVDEAGTHARLKALRKELIEPRIAGHRGRIVKLTGDGALVEFASVVQAVLCAVEVQRAVAERNRAVPEAERLEFRIGVNLGDVILDENDIYGDGVNVAARLEQLCDPGGILVEVCCPRLALRLFGLLADPIAVGVGNAIVPRQRLVQERVIRSQQVLHVLAFEQNSGHGHPPPS